MNAPADRFDEAAFVQAVQRNCDIADARHAADLTLCVYLLQMREQYRWQQRLPLGAALPHADVGAWLDRHEALWDELADAAYQPLPLHGRWFDPFDADAVNARLAGSGLHYGAGRLASGRPLFFVGELLRSERREGVPVRVTGRELARGVAAPPAAFDGGAILLRRDALLRWLWGLHELWAARPEAHAFGAALALCGDVAAGPAVERLAEAQMEALLLHELGEQRAGALLGPDWPALRLATGRDRRIEPHLRALRDHLADCLVTLPALLQRGDAMALHLWFATLEGPRQAMFPAAVAAYGAWRGGDGGAALQAALAAGRACWLRAAEEALQCHRRLGDAVHDTLAASLAALRC